MGSVGDAYDNAMCESFFATLEAELLSRYRFQNQAEAEMACFGYIEGWYNPHRRHSGLGYLSPVAFERRLRPQPGAAEPVGTDPMLTGSSEPAAPVKARLRRAASRSSILDRVSGSDKGWASLNGAPCAGPEPKPSNRPRNGAASHVRSIRSSVREHRTRGEALAAAVVLAKPHDFGGHLHLRQARA